MDLFLHLFYFLISLVILIFSAEKFVSSSSSLAKGLGVSEMTIGLTIIALGTSAPEIFVGISSIINASESIAMGTVVGSNISNIALIFGVACLGAISKPAQANLNQAWPFLLSLLMLGISLLDLRISVVESIVMLIILINFIYFIFKFNSDDVIDEIAEKDDSYAKAVLFIFLGLLGLIVGSYYCVLNAEIVAKIIGVPDLIIGLTIMAIGTSLPELAATIAALIQRKGAMVVGNILGSNILNIVLVVPIIGFFSNIELDSAILSRDFFLLVMLSLLFVITAILNQKKFFPIIATRVFGFVFISVYVLYVLRLSGLI